MQGQSPASQTHVSILEYFTIPEVVQYVRRLAMAQIISGSLTMLMGSLIITMLETDLDFCYGLATWSGAWVGAIVSCCRLLTTF